MRWIHSFQVKDQTKFSMYRLPGSPRVLTKTPKTSEDYSMTDAAGDLLGTEKGRRHCILSTSAARMDVHAIVAPQATGLKQACQ